MLRNMSLFSGSSTMSSKWDGLYFSTHGVELFAWVAFVIRICNVNVTVNGSFNHTFILIFNGLN